MEFPSHIDLTNRFQNHGLLGSKYQFYSISKNNILLASSGLADVLYKRGYAWIG